MLQADEPADLVVATGHAHTVREFAEAAFSAAGLKLDRYLVLDSELSRAKGQVETSSAMRRLLAPRWDGRPPRRSTSWCDRWSKPISPHSPAGRR